MHFATVEMKRNMKACHKQNKTIKNLQGVVHAIIPEKLELKCVKIRQIAYLSDVCRFNLEKVCAPFLKFVGASFRIAQFEVVCIALGAKNLQENIGICSSTPDVSCLYMNVVRSGCKKDEHYFNPVCVSVCTGSHACVIQYLVVGVFYLFLQC